MTQAERVLKALRSYRGCCQVDFLAPDVADGGKPITRVAARIQDLRDKGHEIEIIGRRHGCVVYRLVSTPDVERGAPPTQPPACGSPGRVSLDAGPPDTLFGIPRRKGRHGFADQEAAA